MKLIRVKAKDEIDRENKRRIEYINNKLTELIQYAISNPVTGIKEEDKKNLSAFLNGIILSADKLKNIVKGWSK